MQLLFPGRPRRSVWKSGLVVLLAFVAFWSEATPSAHLPQETYESAKARLAARPDDSEALGEFGRASAEWAERAATADERTEIAEDGAAACRKLIEQANRSVAGHYYLGLNLAQLVKNKKSGALKLSREAEAEFKTVLTLDPKYDFAGADRNLGLLYLDAPGWPFGVGNKSQARKHLAKALELAPDYPENHLELIEAELKMGDKAEEPRQLKALAANWPEAQKKFAGEDWAASWADWEERRADAENKIAEKLGPEWADNLPTRLHGDFQKIDINGMPASMFFDTRLAGSGLLEAGARRLGLKSSGSWVDTYGISVRVSELTRVTSAGQTLMAPMPIARVPWWARLALHLVTVPVDGVIGWPEVRDNILVFDSDRRTIRAVDQLPPETAGWLKLKVAPDDVLLLELPLTNDEMGVISVDTSQRGPTGLTMSDAPWKEWEAAHPHVLRADEIKLGALTLTNMKVKEMSAGEAKDLLDEMPTAQALWKFGMSALTRVDLVVDGKNGWAYLHPKPLGLSKASTSAPAAGGEWKVAETVRVNSDNLFVYSGNYKWYKSEFPGAEADYAHALALNPRNADAYSGRGATRVVSGDFSGAVSNYDQVIELRPETSEWEHLYRQALWWRLNRSPQNDVKPVTEGKKAAESVVLLDPVVVYGVRPGKQRWVKTLGLFLDGKLDEKALLADAKVSDGETAVSEQKALAYYYLGMLHLSKGEKVIARKWFQKCQAAGIKDDDEYYFAVAELARMETSASP